MIFALFDFRPVGGTVGLGQTPIEIYRSSNLSGSSLSKYMTFSFVTITYLTACLVIAAWRCRWRCVLTERECSACLLFDSEFQQDIFHVYMWKLSSEVAESCEMIDDHALITANVTAYTCSNYYKIAPFFVCVFPIQTDSNGCEVWLIIFSHSVSLSTHHGGLI